MQYIVVSDTLLNNTLSTMTTAIFNSVFTILRFIPQNDSHRKILNFRPHLVYVKINSRCIGLLSCFQQIASLAKIIITGLLVAPIENIGFYIGSP